jgi:hypothetical protein
MLFNKDGFFQLPKKRYVLLPSDDNFMNYIFGIAIEKEGKNKNENEGLEDGG